MGHCFGGHKLVLFDLLSSVHTFIFSVSMKKYCGTNERLKEIHMGRGGESELQCKRKRNLGK